MRSRWLVVPLALLLVTGYAGADAAGLAPGPLTLAAPARPMVVVRPTPADPRPTPAAPVLAGLAARAQRPAPAGVRTALAPVLAASALGPRVSAYVVDAVTGQVLLDASSARAAVPASTVKLLTGVAVLTSVGGATRLPTRVVQGPTPGEVILVGGGDMLLAPGALSAGVAGRAGLADLATQVARRLVGAGRSRVAVRVDDTLFAGGDVSPRWSPRDVSAGYTGRVAALGLATDRARSGHPSSRDPALTAAAAFAAALRRAGIGVAGAPSRAVAPASSAVLATVQSAPVADVLDLALLESDNALAEVLARLVARHLHRPTTAVSGAAAVLEQVARLGLDVRATTMRDASGLAPGSLVRPRLLGDVLALAAGPGRPQLRPLVTGLPVAGLSGTLAERFATTGTRPAAGLVRAKTGTLTGVSALAGTVVDADGRLLVLVVMADRVPVRGTLSARAALDRVAATLAGCGCH